MKLFNKHSAQQFNSALKYAFVSLIGLALIYSFALAPVLAQQARKNCHETAIANAGNLAAQVEEANKQLQEGQEPVQIDQIGVYNTQYTLCMRSKGL